MGPWWALIAHPRPSAVETESRGMVVLANPLSDLNRRVLFREGPLMTFIYDGFWLPKRLRARVITPETVWVVSHYLRGKKQSEPGPGTVSVRWPVLTAEQWRDLYTTLHQQDEKIGPDFPGRFSRAMEASGWRLNDRDDPLGRLAAETLPTITGLSPPMIDAIMRGLYLAATAELGAALRPKTSAAIRARFVATDPEGRHEGRFRFFEAGPGGQVHRWFPTLFAKPDKPLPLVAEKPTRILAYLAWDEMRSARLMTLLAHASVLIEHEGTPVQAGVSPILIVRNSLDDPLSMPMLMTALEAEDPFIVDKIAVLPWDEETAPPRTLLDGFDLILAVDQPRAIAKLKQRYQDKPKPRIHEHGPKVSFTVIGVDYLQRYLTTNNSEVRKIIHRVARLAALDSILWDQKGDRASRIHFVENGIGETYTPLEYGRLLAEKIRELSTILPRGSISMGRIHTRFEKFSEMGPGVHLCSHFEDDFVVVVDERPWQAEILASVLDHCKERTIVIRPVQDIMIVPNKYLQGIDAARLQTVGVAIDGAGHQTWSKRFTRFADAMGARGVTRICSLGRAPFPDDAASWDGYLPLDLAFRRAPGHFTTVTFENAYAQIMKNHALLHQIRAAVKERFFPES